jgi:two-component system response regulator
MSSAIEILIVEDNPDDLELTLYTLRKHQLANHIEIARDGAEALDFIFATGNHTQRRIEDHPRVILLDLKLPKVNGLEVLQRIRADPRTRSIPVVMMTASPEDRDMVESYNFGVNSYIVKPANFVRFADAVRQVGFYWLLLNQPSPASRVAAQEGCSS